jgi:hypothetical protein
MTVAYLDCEFNGYKGDLISLALVIDDNNYFYEVLGCPNPVPWVAENGTTIYIGRVNLEFQPASSTLMEL